MKILAISGSLRQGSHNTDLLRAAAAAAPDGVDIDAVRRAQGDPAVRRRRRHPGRPARAGAAVQGGARRGGRGADRDARVQLVDSGRAQERARLGLPPAGRVASPEQARRRALVEHGDVRRRLGGGGDPQGARRPRCPDARGHRRRAEGRPAARERRRRDAADELRTVVDALATAVEAANRRRQPPRRGSARRRRRCRRARPRAPCARRRCAPTSSRSPSAPVCASSRWSYGRYEVSPSTSSVGIRTCSNGGGCRVISPYAATTALWQ